MAGSATVRALSPTRGLAQDLAGAGLQRRHLHRPRRTPRGLGRLGAAGRERRPAILLCFPGGNQGQFTSPAQRTARLRPPDVTWFLNQVERVFPGTKAAYTGTDYEDHWSLDAWHHGAYSYRKVGQYTSFSGYEQVQERNIHFAGGHTAPEDQGFLSGGVVSGERAATEVQHQV
jgi:monoamine oxidase